MKDYFTGFLVLLEQQYMIGDVVKISGNNFSGLTGQVEQISLRVTILRDIEGQPTSSRTAKSPSSAI